MGLVFFYSIAVPALTFNLLSQIAPSLFDFTVGFFIRDKLILYLFILFGVTPKPMIMERTTKNDYTEKL